VIERVELLDKTGGKADFHRHRTTHAASDQASPDGERRPA
jgi:hypothetical protein